MYNWKNSSHGQFNSKACPNSMYKPHKARKHRRLEVYFNDLILVKSLGCTSSICIPLHKYSSNNDRCSPFPFPFMAYLCMWQDLHSIPILCWCNSFLSFLCLLVSSVSQSSKSRMAECYRQISRINCTIQHKSQKLLRNPLGTFQPKPIITVILVSKKMISTGPVEKWSIWHSRWGTGLLEKTKAFIWYHYKSRLVINYSVVIIIATI